MFKRVTINTHRYFLKFSSENQMIRIELFLIKISYKILYLKLFRVPLLQKV